jgi:hypothetical protein
LLSNLHGKAIEPINIVRDSNGNIVTATFDKSASLGLGSNMIDKRSNPFFWT